MNASGVGGDRVAMSYDALHRPRVKTDQLDDTTTFVYDLAGRLTAKEYRDASATAAPDPDLLAHWPLQTNADDTSGHGYHGQLHGGLAPASGGGPSSGGGGAYPDALQFDGTDDYASFANLPALTDDFTVAAWVRSDTPNWSGVRLLERIGAIQFHTSTASPKPFTFQVRIGSSWLNETFYLS